MHKHTMFYLWRHQCHAPSQYVQYQVISKIITLDRKYVFKIILLMPHTSSKVSYVSDFYLNNISWKGGMTHIAHNIAQQGINTAKLCNIGICCAKFKINRYRSLRYDWHKFPTDILWKRNHNSVNITQNSKQINMAQLHNIGLIHVKFDINPYSSLCEIW